MVNPSDKLRRGRRRIEEVTGLSIIDDLQWDQENKVFYIHICIEIEKSSSIVPLRSEWYITIDPAYPYGDIEVYPGTQNSIDCTFPHQSSNYHVAKNGLWRMGKLCVAFNSQGLGLHAFDKEPLTADDRLFWYAERTVLWVRNAANNTLVMKDDFFELPDFSPSFREQFAYNEDQVSMMQWEDSDELFGLAQIQTFKNVVGTTISYVTAFLSKDCGSIYRPCWGDNLVNRQSSDGHLALWLKLKKPLCVKNWQAPMTFSELQEACLEQGVDFFKVLEDKASFFRDGYSHLVLFGFPVPKRIGQAAEEFVWQALRLPRLSYLHCVNPKFHSGKKKSSPGDALGVPCGYRPGEVGWWKNDRQSIIMPNRELCWIRSENWSNHSIVARGHHSQELCRKRVAIIGAGSLGSTLSELLVRGGVMQLCCIDGDAVFQGNLCRHNLTFENLGQFKSEALAKRLSEINPHARIASFVDYLNLNPDNTTTPDLSAYDTIIDTTGNDQVLEMLGQIADKRKLILSASVGLGANRLYLCMFKKKSPDISAFFEKISPYLIADRKECDVRMSDLPRDGIGCWHPLFPATASDMWIAAGLTQKALEKFAECREHDSLMVVYERKDCINTFDGLMPIEVLYDVV